MAITKDGSKRNAGASNRYLLIGMVIALAFVASYAYATTRPATGSDVALNGATAGTTQYGTTGAAATGTTGGGAAAGGGACGSGGASGGCCGSGGPQTTVKGSTAVTGKVQKVTVDLTGGQYSPNEITAKAGVPIEITFKGPAPSCNGAVVFPDFGISQDVSQGGTITLPALKAGEYQWSCSMQMYFGKIIVK